jgi:hypothetical protein
MAYFAQINGSNIVTNVIVVADGDAANEAAGIAFCKALLGDDTNWVQTFDDGARVRYAGISYTYDATNDVFYRPEPYPSWVLNTSTWEWDAPVALPSDVGADDADNPTEFVSYDWDEGSTSWVNRTVHTLPPPE